MAPRVTFCAPSPVKIAHVTYKVEHVWSVNLGYMAVTVTCRVPLTVKTTHVTDRMEHALHVNLVGMEFIVKQVRLILILLMKISMKIILILSF